MKKLYDWDVHLNIQIENTSKKVSIVCSVHTNIHQIKLQICKKLGMLIFDTDIDLYGGTQRWRPMKPTSTLQQNGIEKNTVIKAVITRQKKNFQIPVQVSGLQKSKEQVDKDIREGCGMNLLACCTNHQCINYQQDTIIHIGYGTFKLHSLIGSLKCEVCPYRNQHLRPNMMVKSILMSYCLYKIQGIKSDHQGIPTTLASDFVKIKEEKNVTKKIIQCGLDPGFNVIIKAL